MDEMASITFKTKIKTMFNPDDTEAYKFIEVPQFKRSHCNMEEWRKHPKFGGLANSDLFPNILARVRKDVLGSNYNSILRMDSLPACVAVDTNGFLAEVTITV